MADMSAFILESLRYAPPAKVSTAEQMASSHAMWSIRLVLLASKPAGLRRAGTNALLELIVHHL